MDSNTFANMKSGAEDNFPQLYAQKGNPNVVSDYQLFPYNMQIGHQRGSLAANLLLHLYFISKSQETGTSTHVQFGRKKFEKSDIYPSTNHTELHHFRKNFIYPN